MISNLFDYAGLFPPAALPLDQVLAHYAQYLSGDDAWALGRLVLRSADLPPFVEQRRGHSAEPWSVSLLPGPQPLADLLILADWCSFYSDIANIDVVELKLTDTLDLVAVRDALPAGVCAYVELPFDAEPFAAVERIKASGLRAKLRCGGVTADAFPSPKRLLSWLQACVAAELPFKATAGLHHPLCGRYKLTYAAASERAPMFGFLNLLLATVALRSGADANVLLPLLTEDDPAQFHWEQDSLRWHSLTFSSADLAATRRDGLIAIGSCSFREPIDELGKVTGFGVRARV